MEITDRQREVAAFYAAGADWRATAAHFGIAPATVHVHLRNFARRAGIPGNSRQRPALLKALNSRKAA